MILQKLFTVGLAAAAVGCWSMSAKNTDPRAASPAADATPFAVPTPKASATAAAINANSDTTSMTGKGTFYDHLPKSLSHPTDDVSKLLLREYGSVFVTKAAPPTKIVFEDENDVTSFQKGVERESASIGGSTVTLQKPALEALKAAIAEAQKSGISIGPRGGDSSIRSYTQTVTLWASRVKPALAHWSAAGKITKADAARIASLSPYEQVSEVLGLESKGIWFAKSLDKSIIYSVAPPGTSQHLSMLALDVKQFDDPRVREILARHGWFQTISSDLPHFTFLGASESDLPSLGLKKITSGNRAFWVPDI
ncbi:MAG TPA: D-alanyl-D-alanine carboxypeptidase family protein [Pyrinomonadaceae bacterium]|nr:D-alanyl-D-alanine carboxypeptidase family protein [Pyrinomonadaceae bacterium]